MLVVQMNTDERYEHGICVHLCSSVVSFIVLVAAPLRHEIRGQFFSVATKFSGAGARPLILSRI